MGVRIADNFMFNFLDVNYLPYVVLNSRFTMFAVVPTGMGARGQDAPADCYLDPLPQRRAWHLYSCRGADSESGLGCGTDAVAPFEPSSVPLAAMLVSFCWSGLTRLEGNHSRLWPAPPSSLCMFVFFSCMFACAVCMCAFVYIYIYICMYVCIFVRSRCH